MITSNHSDLYEKDFFAWLYKQADLLKKHKFNEIDIENIVEEIETLGRTEKRTLKSFLVVLLLHMLKQKYQPEKATKSWQESIDNAKNEISFVLEDSPSLNSSFAEILKKSYQNARTKAASETDLSLKTFPENCPWTEEEILDIINK